MNQSSISGATGEKLTQKTFLNSQQTIGFADSKVGISRKIIPRTFYIHDEVNPAKQKKGTKSKEKNKEKFYALTKAFEKKQLPMLARVGGLHYDQEDDITKMVIRVERHIESLKR